MEERERWFYIGAGLMIGGFYCAGGLEPAGVVAIILGMVLVSAAAVRR